MLWRRVADHLVQAIARTILVLGAVAIVAAVVFFLVSQRVIIIWGR